MALTERDLLSVEKIVDKSTQGLKELFLEKLNGHVENSARLAKEIEQLYELDRGKVKEIAGIKSDLIKLEGKVDAHAQISVVEEEARAKREAAIDKVKANAEEKIDKVENKADEKGQFSITTWVAIGCAILGPLIVAFLLGGHK